MSERFSVLQKSQDNMYREGSPIIVSATALLKDTVTDNIITQIKFLNISESTIKAVKVSIKAFDVTGRSVEGITKSASIKQDWTTKQTTFNFGLVSSVFVRLRVENRSFAAL